MKQIMMVGAGSVGGFFGAHLAKNNPNVSFLLRPQDLGGREAPWLDDQERQGQFHRPSAGSLRSATTRGAGSHYSRRQGLRPRRGDGCNSSRCMTERTVILTFQNGIDTEDRIIARVHAIVWSAAWRSSIPKSLNRRD